MPTTQGMPHGVRGVPSDCYNNSLSDTRFYIGATEGPFNKKRYANYLELTSLCHDRYETSTELSMHFWKLKRSNVEFNISGILRERYPVLLLSQEMQPLSHREAVDT